MIIAGIGTALGWGAGVVATVTAFFVGAPIAGPLAWIAGGVAVTMIAGYFALSGNANVDTERFLKALKNSTGEAVKEIWSEHGIKLAQ